MFAVAVIILVEVGLCPCIMVIDGSMQADGGEKGGMVADAQ